MNIALVTGAGRGLGQGFAEVLSSKSYFVYAGVRDTRNLPQHPNVKYIQMDVTSDDSIKQTVSQIKSEHGKLNILVNNAGLNKDTATSGHIEKATQLDALERKVLQEMFNVNATSPMMVTKYAVPLMTEPDSFVINISSNRGSFGDETNTVGNYGYRASKTALNMFTRALLFDLPATVSTFAVHPGFVRTDMNPRGNISPSEAAELIIGIMEDWKPELNGHFLHNDGSLYAL